MKRNILLSIAFLLATILTACSLTNSQDERGNVEEITSDEIAEEVNGNTQALTEPDEESVCHYCNMKVYQKGTEMGVFSTQAITADGKTLFFDDVGCMLNQERADNETYDKYVRDYHSEEWIKLEEAYIVKAEIKTPMNYGYAFFVTIEDASRFIEEIGVDKASFADLENIDEEASHRHIKKMENGSEMGEHHHGHAE